MMNSIIIGGGEVGHGLYRATKDNHDTQVVDVDPGKCVGYDSPTCDILHICIPGTLPNFEELVFQYVDKYEPKVTVINSTVKLGTTRKIAQKTFVPTFHSPIRGKHPDLEKHIQTYTKHIGYITTEDLDLVTEFFHEAGIETHCVLNPETTELGKILELYRYGINVVVADVQNKLCKRLGLDYKTTVDDFILTYNKGLDEVGLSQYHMPTIKPPTGQIGGHCVVQNTKLITEQLWDLGVLDYDFKMLAELITNCNGAAE